MSFYGNVFQELTTAFTSIVIQSKFNDATVTQIDPLGTGGKFTFAPGDEWITMDGDAERYACLVKHAAADSARQGVVTNPFSRATAAAGALTELAAGDIIAVPAIKYDNAGHIINTDTINYFKLPPLNDIEVNVKDLQDRMDSIEVNEESQNSRMGAIEDTYQGFTESMQSIEDQMETLTKAEDAQNTDIETLTMTSSSHQTSIEDLQSRTIALEDLPPKVQTLEEISKTTVELLGTRDNMTTEENLTITEVIGDFDTLNKNLKYNDICDGLTTLTSGVAAANSSTSNNALAVRVAINKLCDILNAYGITDQDGNPIDSNKLWNI